MEPKKICPFRKSKEEKKKKKDQVRHLIQGSFIKYVTSSREEFKNVETTAQQT